MSKHEIRLKNKIKEKLSSDYDSFISIGSVFNVLNFSDNIPQVLDTAHGAITAALDKMIMTRLVSQKRHLLT